MLINRNVLPEIITPSVSPQNEYFGVVWITNGSIISYPSNSLTVPIAQNNRTICPTKMDFQITVTFSQTARQFVFIWHFFSKYKSNYILSAMINLIHTTRISFKTCNARQMPKAYNKKSPKLFMARAF